MYFDEDGTSCTLEIRPYVQQATSLQRKERNAYQDLRQKQILCENRTKRFAEGKVAETPVVYKSPEHVRTVPDYDMAIRPCIKKKKKKRCDVDECFSLFVLGNTTRNRTKKRRGKTPKKRVSIFLSVLKKAQNLKTGFLRGASHIDIYYEKRHCDVYLTSTDPHEKRHDLFIDI